MSWKIAMLCAVFLLVAVELAGLRGLNFQSEWAVPEVAAPEAHQQQVERQQQDGLLLSELCITLDDTSLVRGIKKEWIPGGTSSLRVVISAHTEQESIQNLFQDVAQIPRSFTTNYVAGAKHVMCVLNNSGPTYASLQCLRDALLPNTTGYVVVTSQSKSYSWLSMVNRTNFLVMHHSTAVNDTTPATIGPTPGSSNKRPLLNNHVVLYLPSEQKLNIGDITSVVPNYATNITVMFAKPDNLLLMHQTNGTTSTSLTDFLIQMYPLANVSGILCDESYYTEPCHDTMMASTLLVCFDSLACILPSLTMLDSAATILAGPKHYSWLSSLRPALRNSNVKVARWTATDSNSTDDSSSRQCQHARGKIGRWRFDPSYPKSSTHSYHDSKWIPTSRAHLNDTQRHNKFVWEDDICPVSLFTKEGFCRTMKELGYRRLFAIGDSLQFMAMICLSHLLGLKRTKVHRHLQSSSPLLHYSETLQCSPGFDIELAFYRSNHYFPVYGTNASLLSNSTNVSIHDMRKDSAMARIASEEDLRLVRTPRVYFVCNGLRKSYYPDEHGNCLWVDHYLQKDVPTLFWMSAGPHTHLPRIFKESVDNFAGFLRRYKRPSDLVLLRTLSPGHPNCAKAINPYKSFPEYLEHGQTTEWDWHLFVQYNKIIEDQVLRISRDTNWTGATVELHDIYWMTALRQDGHPNADDCLHYLLPGPPDWWIHTLYSKLQDLAEAKKRRQV